MSEPELTKEMLFAEMRNYVDRSTLEKPWFQCTPEFWEKLEREIPGFGKVFKRVDHVVLGERDEEEE